MSTMEIILAAGAFVGGFACGLAYFALLAWSVRSFAANKSTVPHVALLALRVALVMVAFVALAHAGGAALLTGLAGFVVARFVVHRRAKFE